MPTRYNTQHARKSALQQENITDLNFNRNTGTAAEPRRPDERAFALVVDDVPYFVNTIPFYFNGETRFYVNINGGDAHVFTWDSELGMLRAIDDNASTLPDALEEAISMKLQSKLK